MLVMITATHNKVKAKQVLDGKIPTKTFSAIQRIFNVPTVPEKIEDFKRVFCVHYFKKKLARNLFGPRDGELSGEFHFDVRVLNFQSKIAPNITFDFVMFSDSESAGKGSSIEFFYDDESKMSKEIIIELMDDLFELNPNPYNSDDEETN